MSRPRPISSCRPPATKRHVHFPPSPVLTRMCLAHSPSSYDRTPIAVEQNVCALPARGCPGRTYTLSTNERAPRHPNHCPSLRDAMRNEDEHTVLDERIPNGGVPPPLIPDLTSSSDESDGMLSPPPEFIATPTPKPSSKSFIRPESPLANTSPNALSFLPYAPPSPTERAQRQQRRNRDRRSSPARTAALLAAQRAVPSSPPAVDDLGSFKRLSLDTPASALATCALEDADEACLAGF
jgi:hypothetical protein